jgi:hypothetical protein
MGLSGKQERRKDLEGGKTGKIWKAGRQENWKASSSAAFEGIRIRIRIARMSN